MKWTTTQLIAAGAMGALFALAALSEIPLNVLTGIVGLGGVVGTFFEVVVFSFAILLLNRFGAGAIVAGVAGALLLPLPVFGPAGFLPKVALLFGFGLLYDVLFLYFRRLGRWGLALTNIAILLLFDAAIGAALLLFNLFAMGLVLAAVLNAVFIIEGIAGSLVAWHLFQKMKRAAVVRRIQSNAA